MKLKNGLVRHLRRHAFMTQEELAKTAGMTPAALSRIETGRSDPRPSSVRKIAEALGVEPTTLVDTAAENALLAAASS